MARRWQLGAFGLATAAALFLLLGPAVRSSTGTASSPGSAPAEFTEETLSLLQSEGPSVLPVLAVPVLLTLAPLLLAKSYARAASLVCTGLLMVGVVLTGFTIGLLFVPALIAAIVACAMYLDSPRSPGRRPAARVVETRQSE
ncbi:hypothetical protein BH24ACT13_BH24ACT13_06110 [soil metagenome]|jgi:hypothetical protein